MDDPRVADMGRYELPDDDPLPEEELDRITRISALSRARLVHEAASRRMTPMELFASGLAHAEHADDRLVYDESRQLPGASRQVEQPSQTPAVTDGAQADEDAPRGRLSERHPLEQSLPRVTPALAARMYEEFAAGFAEGMGASVPELPEGAPAAVGEALDPYAADDEVIEAEVIE